jgi:hypothetical protein
MFEFMLSSLATWRIAHMLVKEDGPWDLISRFRSIIGVRYDEYSVPYGTNMPSAMLSCVWCASVWVAAIVAIFEKHVKLHMYIRRLFALSAMAIYIEEKINDHQ